ncbi:hypothetical protein GOP47_0020445 [Adiantum capillus-veneris]|uniref:Uncharacterized protein n=1 Tax=Adiantum capillus-veneris TaxID=13818 RepID=A0A9D4Z7G0_ADICA|nr:hypothetical protein GOP47_0020445 [Adiantum capillus-veneris]
MAQSAGVPPSTVGKGDSSLSRAVARVRVVSNTSEVRKAGFMNSRAKERKSAWCSRVANSLLQTELKIERACGARESPILSCRRSSTMAGAGRGHSPGASPLAMDPRKENPMDKFAGGSMDVEAVKAFFCWGRGRAIKRTLEVFTNTMGQELRYRAALCQLFPAFWMLSKKATHVVDVGEEYDESKGCDEESGTSGGSSQSPYLHRTIFMSTGMC